MSEQKWKELERIAQFVGYRDLEDFLIHGLQTDGGQHKQWYLEQLADGVGVELSEIDYEKGIAP